MVMVVGEMFIVHTRRRGTLALCHIFSFVCMYVMSFHYVQLSS